MNHTYSDTGEATEKAVQMCGVIAEATIKEQQGWKKRNQGLRMKHMEHGKKVCHESKREHEESRRKKKKY